MHNNISVYLKPEEKEMIKEAGKIASLNQSSFIRAAAMKEARKICREESE